MLAILFDIKLVDVCRKPCSRDPTVNFVRSGRLVSLHPGDVDLTHFFDSTVDCGSRDQYDSLRIVAWGHQIS